ncbi:O-antigen ligase family protein [Winogradskyella marincola]|uniref:O-antigen ligase family protein n=1 Tax=Winogradskyella marincola TaxID=3037795 RepID=A0ABT6FZH5_9FLAO|nr:O-antigen ligase family protein [Winogradskyella sp. YYF002]MDG4715193.1 O-antigen ligase family protein [Winogradskyella sp. YYF002]
MRRTNDIWETIFSYLTLVLLCSILLGYFFSSLAFGIWFAFSIIWILKIKQFHIQKAIIPFLCFSLFSIISVIWSVDKSQTIHGIGRQAPLFLFAISGIFLPKISLLEVRKIFNRFSVFVCCLATILIILAVLRYYKYEFEEFLYYHELVSPLELNAIYVSYVVSFCFLYTLQDNVGKVILKTIKFVVLGFFLVLLSSKMILTITVFISAIMVFFKIKRNLHRLILLGFIFITSVLILVFANPIKNRFVSEFNTSYTEILNEEKFEKGRVYTGIEARLLQVRVFNEIINSPKNYLLGVGLDASKKEIRKVHQRLNTPIRFHTYNFHNQYLQIFAELGIVGLLIFIISLILALKRAFKIKYLLPFIIISMSLFITESVIWRQRGILFFGTLYILLFTLDNQNESKEQLR